MKVIQSKSFFEEKIGPDSELNYNDIIFKYNPENINVSSMTQLYEKQLLVGKIRSYAPHGVSSYYFVEDNNVDEVFKVLKNLADSNTKPPHLTFEFTILDEFDEAEIISNPNNFLVEIYNPSKLISR